MKKKLAAVFVALACGNVCFALDILIADGTLYRDCVVSAVEREGVRITHGSGVSFLPFDQLPSAMQKQYGWTAEKSAALKAEKLAIANRAKQERIASELVREEQMQAHARDQQKQTLAQNERVKAESAARAGADKSDIQKAVENALTKYSVPIIGAVIFAGLFWVLRGNATRNRQRRLLAEAKKYLFGRARNGKFPPVETGVLLKAGEVAFYDAPSALYETRAVRSYQSGSVGIRLAKGLWIGGSQGRSVSNQEWTKLGLGTLTVTNKRIIFEGDGLERCIVLGKVVSLNSWTDALEVFFDSRQKSMAFGAANPFIVELILRAVCGVAANG